MFAMGSHDERCPVTLQIELMDRSKISVQTELDLTVEEFKQVLADLTGIPSNEQWLIHKGRILKNPQMLRSCELDPDQSICLVCIASPPSSTSPSETCGLDATNVSDKKPQIRPLINYPGSTANIIKNIPFLSWMARSPKWATMLENTRGLHNVLLFLMYATIKRRTASSKADITDNIKADTEGSRTLKSAYEVPKVKSVYEVHGGISHGTEENQLSLGLLGLNLVGTSGSGPKSSNSNQSELAPNSDLLSGPESSNANLSESAPNSNPLPNPWAASSYRGASSSQMEQVSDSDDELVGLSYWQKVYKRSVNILVPIILSDATLLRRCKKQGESVERAYVALLKASNVSRDLYNSAYLRLVVELDVYYRPILEKLLPLQNDADYGSSSSSDDETDFAPEEVASEELFGSQLAELEQMGFMDRRENIRALLNSWGDVKKAVDRLNSRKTKS